MENNYYQLIGCDPSYQNFGVCIYDTRTKQMTLKTGNLLEMVKWINANVDKKRCIAVIENSGLVSAVFKTYKPMDEQIEMYGDNMAKYHLANRSGTLKPNKPNRNDCKSQYSIGMKVAQHIGAQKLCCTIIADIFKSVEIPVYEVSPAWRDRADKAQQKANKAKVNLSSLTMPTKTTAIQFQELTGYGTNKGERSNEHNRDAAMLVWGKTCDFYYKKIKNLPNSYPKSTNDNEMITIKEKEISFYNDPDPTDLIKGEDIFLKVKLLW